MFVTMKWFLTYNFDIKRDTLKILSFSSDGISVQGVGYFEERREIIAREYHYQ